MNVDAWLAENDPASLIGTRWRRTFGPLDLELVIGDVMVATDGRVLVTGARGWIKLESLLSRYTRVEP
jgi:hypothetical protein